jgi:RNA polymerase sigma-70 factor (ECF subfamily)
MDGMAAARMTEGGIGAMAPPRVEDFASIVIACRPKVFRYALASLRDRDAAETVAQDCFIRAHNGWQRFRRDCSIETWLMQIAVNLVRDHLRNRKIRFWKRVQLTAVPVEAIGGCIADAAGSAEDQVLLKERVEAVWEAAGNLPERQRTVFLLRFVEDMELLEIAAVTGMKEGTVKTHLFRALRTVRDLLGAGT